MTQHSIFLFLDQIALRKSNGVYSVNKEFKPVKKYKIKYKQPFLYPGQKQYTKMLYIKLNLLIQNLYKQVPDAQSMS